MATKAMAITAITNRPKNSHGAEEKKQRIRQSLALPEFLKK